MDLDKNWNWKKKKLACRIRTETGNPAGDSLREMFAELAGVDLNDLLSEMKTTKKKKEATNKVLFDHEGDKTFKEVLSRSRVLGASKLALEKMAEEDQAKAASIREKNIRKTFAVIPPSPPKRVLLEIQRERSKPLRLPDQEEQKTTTAKLEKKLAKQRAARMAAIEQSAKEEEERKKLNSGHSLSRSESLMGTILPSYEGDQFGTAGSYLNGMMYLSRMADASIKTRKHARNGTETSEKVDVTQTQASNEKSDDNKEKDNHNTEDDNNGTAYENHTSQDASTKLNCAISLCNWSRNPANASRLASEGAVRAIMQLSLEPINKMAMYCASTFRYMSEQSELAVSMIDEGAVSTISDLINSSTDEFAATNLAIALVNLTRVNGKEGQVVEAAIVLALMNLIMIKPELGAACARGLYNLTCVDSSYQFIERVIRALITLSMSGNANVKHLCAAALCNLSDLKTVRPRMVEEGAINVLTTLSRGAETRTRRVCAVILQNLSAAKSVRVEMASRNSVTAAYGLSSDQDPIILRCIGLTLSRLAMEPTNCQRIVHENGITALCNIAVKYPTIPGISQPVASAFQLLSCNQAFRVSIVSEGSVTAIASFLRSSVDMFTLQHSLLSLCNLLCEPDNHLPIIQQGLITTLIALCEQENDLLRDFCSLAFLNLSCAEDSRKHIVNSGAIVAILSIAKQDSELTKRRCAATLCNISYYNAGMPRMVADGMIPAIVSLVLSKDILTVHYSCAALCRLCSTIDNARLILESGAVPKLVQGSIEGDPTSKQFCGAVLSSLSFYESCRIVLCEMGAISALKGLAEFNDDVTRQRCLVAFANISCEVSVQSKMVSEGVVGIIAELANSYQEINYICCAKAICNLACSDASKLAVAKEGGVHALLMISMVQSVDRLTKLLCVLGLNNLLNENTLDFMLEEGLISSIANLSKIGDTHISNLCAKIFNHLTKYLDARYKIVDKKVACNALFKLGESKMAETQILAIRTTCNLVFCGHVRSSIITIGAYHTLERGIRELSNKDTVHQCMVAIFSTCNDTNFMELMTKTTTLSSTLVLFATRLDTAVEDYTLALKTLTMLAWSEKSRLFLQTLEFFQLIIALVKTNLKKECAVYISALIRFLVIGYSNHAELLENDLLTALAAIDHLVNSSTMNDSSKLKVYSYLVGTSRTITSNGSAFIALANENILTLLNNASSACASSSTVIYDIAVLMYFFATYSAETRLATATPTGASILKAVQFVPKASELLVVSLGSYLMDSACRMTFTKKDFAAIFVKIAHSEKTERMTFNLSLAIYAFCKISACRDILTRSDIAMDQVLTQPAFNDSPKVKNNTSRALKNLASDLNEAIEEGMVANLIAISLEGKPRPQMSDEFELLTVELPVEKNLAKLDYMDEAAKNYDGMMWYEPVMVTKGGAAGKGPEPPEPPAMHVDGSSEYPHMTEELETHESEGKTKMAFAKMQVPQGLKESSLLQDADFVLKKTSEKETTETLEDGSDSEEKGTENQEKVEDAKEVHPKDEASVASIEKPNSRESVYDQEPEDLSPQSSVRSMGKPRKSVRTNKSKETGTMSDQAARLGLYN